MSDKTIKGSSNVLACDMRKLCNNQLLSDVSFEIGSERKIFHAHRCILSARCEIFKSMFTEQSSQLQTTPVVLQEMNPAIFKQLLEFLYTNQIKIEKNTIDETIELLAISLEFGLDDFRKNLQNHVVHNLNKDNVCKILFTAQTLGLNQMKDCCMKYIFSHIKEISDFNDLSSDLMEEIVASDELDIDELQLVDLVRNWAIIKGAKSDTAAGIYGKPVCRHLRLGLLKPEQIAQLEEEDEKDRIIPPEAFALAWKIHALGTSANCQRVTLRKRNSSQKSMLSHKSTTSNCD